MDTEGLLERIRAEVGDELRRSDIVWPKYGSESVDTLAERITVRVGATLAAPTSRADQWDEKRGETL